MSNKLKANGGSFASRSRKRKRSPEDEANEKVEAKRRKVEARYDRLRAMKDSETILGKFEDKVLYDVNDVLVEQEKIVLRKDPFGSNFLATTWSNDGTLLRKDALTPKLVRIQAYIQSDMFPEEIFAEILSHCDPTTLASLMRVSLSMNKLLSENQLIWRKLFYRRHWRLKHDIENNFVGTDPDLVDRSSWANVIPDNQIDWFGEYKRNHINAKIIKNTIEEIKSKLQRFVNAFAEVKEGVTNPLFFEPGVTDEEIDDRIVMDGIPITNDLRELLKCCNGARFFFDKLLVEFHYETFRIIFPSLEKLSVGPYTVKHSLHVHFWGWGNLDDESSDEYLETDDIPQELRTSTPTPSLSFNASEMQSDSDEYTMCDDDKSMEDEDEDNMSTKRQSIDRELIINDKLILFNITDKKFQNFADSPQQVYCPQTGSIDYYTCFGDDIEESFSSIILYLQDLSDYLDCGHSVKWLKFDDYTVGDWDDDEYWFIEGINEPWKIGQTVTTYAWDSMTLEVLDTYSEVLRILPRASKILYAAAQDFLIKVFTKAWSLETTDTLQPDTLIEAANQVTCTKDRDYERVTSDEDLDDYDSDVDI